MLKKHFGLENDVMEKLVNGLEVEKADLMVENVVGIFGLPLGLAPNFLLDGEPVVVPMAVEEPSVVAACAHVAKLLGGSGGMTTQASASLMTGQVQILDYPETVDLEQLVRENQARLVSEANRFCPGLYRRGGGCQKVSVHRLDPLPPDHPHYVADEVRMGVLHFTIDCLDAMGANAVNTVVEGVAPLVEELTQGRVLLRILSNLSDQRLAKARFEIPVEHLNMPGVSGSEVAAGVVAAYRFAAIDPYRAATHNKGIMNGIDAVAIATGNDWRALESGVHAFAARAGRYSSLSRYALGQNGKTLIGEIELPLAVGTVGGSTQFHPSVVVARQLMGEMAASSERLARVMAAVGLAQNFAAIKALATEGIQKGHMRLHARQIALAVGAKESEVKELIEIMRAENNFQPGFATVKLAEIRGKALKKTSVA
tara:strand:+ start:1515 stop:2795 length:1281 start_codon:yes stop_codon:yes gene_type:complete